MFLTRKNSVVFQAFPDNSEPDSEESYSFPGRERMPGHHSPVLEVRFHVANFQKGPGDDGIRFDAVCLVAIVGSWQTLTRNPRHLDLWTGVDGALSRLKTAPHRENWQKHCGCVPQPQQAWRRFGTSQGSPHARLLLIRLRRQARGVHRSRVAPPSMSYAEPVMNAASSEQRNAASAAISSGLPIRPIG